MRAAGLILYFFLLLTPTAGHAEQQQPAGAGPTAPVRYNAAADLLSIEANGLSLRTLLGQVNLLTGVEILLSASAERPVTARIIDLPTDQALRQLARTTNLNHAFLYAEASPKTSTTLALAKFLGRGGKGDDLIKVLGVEREAVARTKSAANGGAKEGAGGAIRDIAAERWQARLEALPEEQRRELEDRAAEKVAREGQRQDDRQKNKEEAKTRRKQREERSAKRDEALRAADPAAHEERLRRREQNREELIEFTRREMERARTP